MSPHGPRANTVHEHARSEAAGLQSRTPALVVGAGRWARVHAEKLLALPGVRVVGVVDPVRERAEGLAARFPGAQSAGTLAELDGLWPAPQIALVVTSLPALCPSASALLARGVHVLVEKPGATTRADAVALVAAAQAAGRVLAIGFVERFNPGIAALPRDGRRLVVRRQGPGRPEIGPLALDWLIHDLDMAAYLLGPGLQAVAATAGSAPEALRVRLAGPDGVAALLHARRGPERVTRRLRLDGTSVDLLDRRGADPLLEQWWAFLAAVAGDPAPRLARGDAAVAALGLVDEIGRITSAARESARCPPSEPGRRRVPSAPPWSTSAPRTATPLPRG